MLSEEAQIGKRVRVRENHRTANWRGQEGTITKRWGDPTYTALDVLLKCGLVGSERKDVLGAKLAFDARWE